MDGSLPDSRVGQTIDRYRIESLLGKGGMGVVYLAEDTRLKRQVAIKFAVLPDHTADDSAHTRAEFLARFEREARLAASLAHPNIATVHDSGVTADGQPYLVMEYIRGRSLQAALQAQAQAGGLSLAARIDIIIALASALAAAHQQGILHRDIKPANVLLTESGQPKVLDFGLAKQLVAPPAGQAENAELDEYAQTQASSITRRHTLLGTPHFMSPEQIEHSGPHGENDAKLDGRSDLYSLGVILYQCLTNQLPFTGKDTMKIIAQVLRDLPTPPAQLNAQVTPELNAIAMTLLAKAREARYATAADLLTALKSARATLPETAAPGVTNPLPNPLAVTPSTVVSPASVTIRLPSQRTAWRAGVVSIALLTALALWWRFAHNPGYQPSPKAADLYQKGIVALHDSAYQAAERSFTDATKAEANFALAWARLAEAQFEMDLQRAAQENLLRATNSAQQLNQSQQLELEAIRHTLLRDHTQAAQCWQQLTDSIKAPAQLAALLDLGRAYDRASQTELALTTYRQAYALDPQAAAVNLRLGILLGRKQDPNAESALQRAENTYQTQGKLEGEATVSYWRGVRLQAQRDFPNARAALQTALAKSQTLNHRFRYLITLVQLGSLEYEAGQNATAIQTLQTAERESLSSFNLADWARINLAICYQQQQPVAAEALYQRVIASTSEHETPYNQALAQVNYASFLLQQKRRDEAQAPARAAYSFFQNAQYQDELMRTTRLLARLWREQMKLDDAREILQKPLQFTRANQEVNNLALLLLEQARIETLRGNLPLALRLLTEDRPPKSEAPVAYELLDQAKAAWRVGDYAQSNQALEALQKLPDLSPGYLMRTALVKTEAALSQRDLAAALNHVTPAVASSDPAVRLLAQVLQNYAQALSGTPRAKAKLLNAISGNDLNQLLQEQDLDFQITALWYSATTALATQDGTAAQPPLERLTTIATQLGNPELQWRVAALNARHSQQAGGTVRAQQQATQARQSLAQLRKQWGEPSSQRYLSRPDLQQLHEQLP